MEGPYACIHSLIQSVSQSLQPRYTAQGFEKLCYLGCVIPQHKVIYFAKQYG